MISLELLTKHMAWANQEIYKEVKNLDPEVLDYFVVDKEWTVRTIMVHIVAASYLYSQRLMGKPFSKFEFDLDSPNLIDDLMSELEKIDKSLIEQGVKNTRNRKEIETKILNSTRPRFAKNMSDEDFLKAMVERGRKSVQDDIETELSRVRNINLHRR